MPLKLRKNFITTAVLSTLVCYFSLISQALCDDIKIVIFQTSDHIALNTVTRGIKQGLYAQHPTDKIEINVESAQSDITLANQIANKIINSENTAVVTVGTMTSQTMAKYAQKGLIKLIFSSVTDPIQARLVKNLEIPEKNISGVSNFVDLEAQIRIIKEIQPTLNILGIIYSPAEMNSVSVVGKLQSACEKIGIKLIKQQVIRLSEMLPASIKLAQQCDAIMVNNDNIALKAIRTIASGARSVHKPVYSSDTDTIGEGILAAVGPDQFDIGLETAKIVNKIIEKPEIIEKVQFPGKIEIHINQCVAQSLNINISNEVLAKAKQVAKCNPDK